MRYLTIRAENVCQAIAIHRSAYHNDHFTSRLNDQLLADYYIQLTQGEELSQELSFLALDGDTPIALVVCGKGINSRVKRFVRAHWLKLLPIILINRQFLWAKLKAVFTRFSKSTWKSSANIRLVSIAVHKDSQSNGIGSILLEELERRLRALGQTSYGLSVKKKNIGAIKFYSKHGFAFEYADKATEYYIKQLQ